MEEKEINQNSENVEVIYIDNQKIFDDLAKVSNRLMLGNQRNKAEEPEEPFFAHFFTGLIKKIDYQIDTLAVSYQNGLVTLHINPIFWEKYLSTIQYRVGGIKHELLHIVFKHIFRYHAFSHKTIFNVAADIIVNQYILKTHLIEGCVLLEDFPEMNLRPNEHLNYYYNALMELYQKYNGACDSEESKNNKSWQNLKKYLDHENENQKRHAFWKQMEKLSSAEKEIAESAINQALENTLRRLKPDQYGKLPSELQQYLDSFQQSLLPVINWKRILKLFANSSSRTRVRNTMRRPSKRYGTNPGIQVKKKQKILIAIDTSGSIQMDELREFFNEIYHIWKQGAQIQVVECDTAIHRTYTYKGKSPQTVSGGGGTAFEAPIKYANEEYRPDALIYFTDGYGGNPTIKSNCPVLWLLSKNGAGVDYIKDFQGRKVKMT